MGRTIHNASEFRDILRAVTEEAQHLVQDTLNGGPLLVHGERVRQLHRELEARVATREIRNQLIIPHEEMEAHQIENSDIDRQINELRQHLTHELSSTFGIPADQLEGTGRGHEVQWGRQEILGTWFDDRSEARAESPTYGTSVMDTMQETARAEIERQEDQWAMYRLYDAATGDAVQPRDPLDARFVRNTPSGVADAMAYAMGATIEEASRAHLDRMAQPAPPTPSRPREEPRTVSFEPGQRIIDIEG